LKVHRQCPLVLLIKVDCREFGEVGSKEGKVLGSVMSENRTEGKVEYLSGVLSFVEFCIWEGCNCKKN
jgi:hypothetical protein